MKEFLEMKPTFRTTVSVNDEGYLILSQDEQPEGDTILLSPYQVAILKSSLPLLMDEQNKRWKETAGGDE